MSPNDIESVRSTWRLALEEPTLLHCALTERLTGTLRFRDDRARWVIAAVTQIAEVLDRPQQFELVAHCIVQRRGVVTVADLDRERLALLGAVAELLGTGWDEVARAWSRAIALFSDIVYAAGLDPFAGDDSSSTDPRASAGEP